MITVYTRPGCSACTATKVWLNRNRIGYAERDVSVDREAEIAVAELGYTSLPVIVAGNGHHWSGFRLEQLQALR
jgi:glutaredoxin-like protein NrdH